MLLQINKCLFKRVIIMKTALSFNISRKGHIKTLDLTGLLNQKKDRDILVTEKNIVKSVKTNENRFKIKKKSFFPNTASIILD